MQFSAKVDYAIRALLRLAEHEPESVKIDSIATDGLPQRFVEAILGELRRAQIVRSLRGHDGGYRLTRPASTITLGQIIRVVDGPLAEIRGRQLDEVTYTGIDRHLATVWTAVHTALSRVLDDTTLAQLLSGRFPAVVQELGGPRPGG